MSERMDTKHIKPPFVITDGHKENMSFKATFDLAHLLIGFGFARALRAILGPGRHLSGLSWPLVVA